MDAAAGSNFVNQAHPIPRPSFPEGKAPAAVLEEIQTNALRCNTLMRQNEALLAQLVYDRDPASRISRD